MHDSKLEDPIDYPAWIGRCGVFLTWFECKDKSLTNPVPHGTFCPVCRGKRKRKLKMTFRSSSAKLAHLEDAFRYLYQVKEHWPKLAAQLYCDCAIASLKEAGEKKLAFKLAEAAGLTNPNLFDELWDELRLRLDKERSSSY